MADVLAIAIQVVTVVTLLTSSVVHLNQRLSRIESTIDSIERRLDELPNPKHKGTIPEKRKPYAVKRSLWRI